MKEIRQLLICKFFQAHKYQIHKEIDKLDVKGNKIGIVIISKCANCGKITSKTIYTETDRM